MPELPEVETNARNLARWMRGRRIVSVVPPPGTRELGGLPRKELGRRLIGRSVSEVSRRGKWILVRLTDGAALGLHLGMTGKLALVHGDEALPRGTRATFALDDGGVVSFVDSRRFGRILAAPWEELTRRPDIIGIGPDALTELTPAQLGAALAGTARTVKEATMDQRLLAGVGNLYATEALWRARIHPATPARTVAADRALTKRLHAAIRAALRQGLRTYQGERVPEYIEEGAPNPFHAYDRAGRPCHRCRTLLKSLVIGGRSSVYCPHCQPTPERRRGHADTGARPRAVRQRKQR